MKRLIYLAPTLIGVELTDEEKEKQTIFKMRKTASGLCWKNLFLYPAQSQQNITK